MNATLQQPTVRGWCPGALRPMESGDGLIVRIRPRAGAFRCTELMAVAELAMRYGNGHIDLTRRANLQLRGVTAASLPALWNGLRAHGLLDANAEAESVRNVMVGPLAGIDPAEIIDPRPIAERLEQGLADHAALWRLPGKFGFAVDGGGRCGLDRERADIRLRADEIDGAAPIAVGLDRADGIDWLGHTGAIEAADVALYIARAFVGASIEPRARMRDLPNQIYGTLRTRIAAQLSPLPGPHPLPNPSGRELGVLDEAGKPFAVGLAAPFGRLEAASLRGLAEAAHRLGAVSLRPSPWRTLYAPVNGSAGASALLAAGGDLGFIADARDPLLRIEACPGAPGCRSATFDAHAIARRIAPLLPDVGCRTCHISGCAKGCASSRVSDLVLVGIEGGIGIARNSTPREAPRVLLSPDRLEELRTLYATL